MKPPFSKIWLRSAQGIGQTGLAGSADQMIAILPEVRLLKI
jgi:hypothetical protein